MWEAVTYLGSIALFAIAILCSKAAYKNGLADGYRAAKSPRDPLWNKTRAILIKMGIQ